MGWGKGAGLKICKGGGGKKGIGEKKSSLGERGLRMWNLSKRGKKGEETDDA